MISRSFLKNRGFQRNILGLKARTKKKIRLDSISVHYILFNIQIKYTVIIEVKAKKV